MRASCLQVYCNGEEVLVTSGTKEKYTVDIWSGNHPFFKGSSNVTLVDEGSVNRFKRRYAGLDSLSDVSKIKTGGKALKHYFVFYFRNLCEDVISRRYVYIQYVERGLCDHITITEYFVICAAHCYVFGSVMSLTLYRRNMEEHCAYLSSKAGLLHFSSGLQVETRQWTCQLSRRARARRRARSERELRFICECMSQTAGFATTACQIAN